MTSFPMAWGAALVCALGGAVAGNAVGSAPIFSRSAITAAYEPGETSTIDRRELRPLPNHYPLVTPNGVVEVAQLSDRGLFSQARYRLRHLVETDPIETLADPYEIVEYTPSEGSAPVLADEPSAAVTGSDNHSTDINTAKIIDVEAALAMR